MVNRIPLDLLPTTDVVGLMLDAEAAVVPAMRAHVAELARAADLLADRVSSGGRLLFAGAGTSGRMAAAEAAELPGTFGLAPERVVVLMAGGATSTDSDEDDLDAARRDLAAVDVQGGDVLIAVAASGSTPYTLACAQAAHGAGAAVVAVINRRSSALAAVATVAVELPAAPEVLRESSRLSAGTAQKIALNAMTTAAMARAGRVHDDLMIDVVAANAKLAERCAAIVAEIAGVELDQASRALQECDWHARAAVVMLVHGVTPADALERVARFQSLREALSDGEFRASNDLSGLGGSY